MKTHFNFLVYFSSAVAVALVLSYKPEVSFADNYNCMYSGWPSKFVNSNGRVTCDKPHNQNPTYNTIAKSCGKNEFMCPVSFGVQGCFKLSKEKELNHPLFYCEKLSDIKAKDLAVKRIKKEDIYQTAFKEMLSVRDNRCKTGSDFFKKKCGIVRYSINQILPRTKSLASNFKALKEPKIGVVAEENKNREIASTENEKKNDEAPNGDSTSDQSKKVIVTNSIPASNDLPENLESKEEVKEISSQLESEKIKIGNSAVKKLEAEVKKELEQPSTGRVTETTPKKTLEAQLDTSEEKTEVLPTESNSPKAAKNKEFNCYYMGWPSKIVTVESNKKLCDRPHRQNPTYRKLANKCSEDEILCPITTGVNTCVSIATREDKLKAHRRCKSLSSEETRSGAAKNINTNPIAQKAFEELKKVKDPRCANGSAARKKRCNDIKMHIKEVEKIFNKTPASTESIKNEKSDIIESEKTGFRFNPEKRTRGLIQEKEFSMQEKFKDMGI